MESNEKIMKLINSHLYNIKGIEESAAMVQKACEYFKNELAADSASIKVMDDLSGQYAEIATYFLTEHAQPWFNNEVKDNCLDALNCIYYKMLAVAKPVMYQRFVHLDLGMVSAAVNRQKPTYKQFRRKLSLAVQPVNEHRKIGDSAMNHLLKFGMFCTLGIFFLLIGFQQLAPSLAGMQTAVVVLWAVLTYAVFLFFEILAVKSFIKFREETGLRRRADFSYTICIIAIGVSLFSAALATYGVFFS